MAREHLRFNFRVWGFFFVCFFLFFHLRLRRKTAWEQVCQIRVCIFSGTSGFLEAYCHMQEKSLVAVWTTASKLLERHPASGPHLTSLFPFCTHHRSLQCHWSVASSEQLQLLHRKTLSFLAAEHVPGTAICPHCFQHGSNKSQWAGLSAIILLCDMNPRHSIKQGGFFIPVSHWNKAEASCSVCACWSASLLLKSAFWSISPLHPNVELVDQSHELCEKRLGDY